MDIVGCIHLCGRDGQTLTVQIHHGVGPGIIIDAFLGIFADVVRENHASFFGRLAELFDEVLGVALGGRLDGPGIDSIGTDADQASAAAGAEGNDLVKGIQQEIPPAVFN